MRHLFTFVCLMLLVSCCGTKETTKTTMTPLKGDFKVTEVTGVDLGMVQPTIKVNTEDQKISGFGGCNQYFATYSMTETSLTMSDMGSTKMNCVQGVEEERQFLEAMGKVNRHTLENGKLTLYNDETVLVKAQSSTM